MQDILRLFLTRITTVGAPDRDLARHRPLPDRPAQRLGADPVHGRHPDARCSRSGRSPGQRTHESLGRTLARFVVPAAVLSSLVGLAVLYGTLFLQAGVDRGRRRGPSSADALARRGQGRPVRRDVVPRVRRLVLVVFVEPPVALASRSSSRGRPTGGPTILAVVLAVAYIVLLVIPAGRAIFALQALGARRAARSSRARSSPGPSLLRTAWRYRLVERFLGI